MDLLAVMQHHVEALGYDPAQLGRASAPVVEDLAYILAERFDVPLDDAFEALDDMRAAL